MGAAQGVHAQAPSPIPVEEGNEANDAVGGNANVDGSNLDAGNAAEPLDVDAMYSPSIQEDEEGSPSLSTVIGGGGGDSSYLRLCHQCGTNAYLRQGICLNPGCRLSYMHRDAQEIGPLLQSWGGPRTQEVATPSQLEARRQSRLQGPQKPAFQKKKNKGKKQKEWLSKIKAGYHPKTGKELAEKVKWKGSWYRWHPKKRWVACSPERQEEPKAKAMGGGMAGDIGGGKAAVASHLYAKATQQAKEQAYAALVSALQEHQEAAEAGLPTGSTAMPKAPSSFAPAPLPPLPPPPVPPLVVAPAPVAPIAPMPGFLPSHPELPLHLIDQVQLVNALRVAIPLAIAEAARPRPRVSKAKAITLLPAAALPKPKAATPEPHLIDDDEDEDEEEDQQS